MLSEKVNFIDYTLLLYYPYIIITEIFKLSLKYPYKMVKFELIFINIQ